LDILKKLVNEISVIDMLHRLPDSASLKSSEAAIFLRVSVTTLERLRKKKTGPIYTQFGESGDRSFNQTCRYIKGDLIVYQNIHRVCNTIDAAKRRGLSFVSFEAPVPKRSELDLTTKRPFYIDVKGYLIGSVEDTMLQEVIERLGSTEIVWHHPVSAILMKWSSEVNFIQYSQGVKATMSLALRQIDGAISKVLN
jgi:hypothetical protein